MKTSKSNQAGRQANAQKVFWLIAGKEFRDSIRDKRLLWCTGTLLIMLSASLVIGLRYSETRETLRRQAEFAQRDQWINKSAANPHVAAHAGTTLFRPNLLLSAIDNGLNNYLGTSVFLEPHRRNIFQQAPSEYTPALYQLGELTPAFTLQMIAPLLLFLTTFQVFSAEREQGTLRLLLGYGVRPADLVTGKIIGTIMPLFLVLTVVTILGTAAVLINDPAGRVAFSFSRFGFMSAGYALYYIVCTTIALVVSALSKTSQKSLLILLGFWSFSSLIVPRIVLSLAQHLYPLPAAEQFVKELEMSESTIPPFMEQRAEIEKELMAEYRVTKAIDLPVSSWGVTLYRREKVSTKLYDQQFDKLFKQYEKQNTFYEAFSFFCPSIAVQMLSMSLAGTDGNHFRNFAEASDAYRYEMVQQMNQVAIDSRLYNASLSAPPDRPPFPEGQRESYLKVRPFKYSIPGYDWALKNSVLSCLALLGWFVISVVSFPRILFKIGRYES